MNSESVKFNSFNLLFLLLTLLPFPFPVLPAPALPALSALFVPALLAPVPELAADGTQRSSYAANVRPLSPSHPSPSRSQTWRA